MPTAAVVVLVAAAVAFAVRRVSIWDSVEIPEPPDYFVAIRVALTVSSSDSVEHHCCAVDGPTISANAAARFDVAADRTVLAASSAGPSISGFVATSFPEFVATGYHSRTTTAAFEVPSRSRSPNSCGSPVSAVPAVASERFVAVPLVASYCPAFAAVARPFAVA